MVFPNNNAASSSQIGYVRDNIFWNHTGSSTNRQTTSSGSKPGSSDSNTSSNHRTTSSSSKPGSSDSNARTSLQTTSCGLTHPGASQTCNHRANNLATIKTWTANKSRTRQYSGIRRQLKPDIAGTANSMWYVYNALSGPSLRWYKSSKDSTSTIMIGPL